MSRPHADPFTSQVSTEELLCTRAATAARRPAQPKLTEAELLASIAAKFATKPADPLEPNPRWLADDELAAELALMQEAAHTPLQGPGMWLAGAMLAAAAAIALLLAYFIDQA
jgi:hypothetical protein